MGQLSGPWEIPCSHHPITLLSFRQTCSRWRSAFLSSASLPTHLPTRSNLALPSQSHGNSPHRVLSGLRACNSKEPAQPLSWMTPLLNWLLLILSSWPAQKSAPFSCFFILEHSCKPSCRLLREQVLSSGFTVSEPKRVACTHSLNTC